MVKCLFKILSFIIAVLGGLLMFVAGISPTELNHNVNAWVTKHHIPLPEVIKSADADVWVYRIGLVLLCSGVLCLLLILIAGIVKQRKQKQRRKAPGPDLISYYDFLILYDVNDAKDWWPFFEVKKDGVWTKEPTEDEQIWLTLEKRKELFDHPNPVLRFPCTKEEFEKFTEEFMPEDMICTMRKKQKSEERLLYHEKLNVAVWGKDTILNIDSSSKDRPTEFKWRSITVLTGYIENNEFYVTTTLYGDENAPEVPVVNNRNTISALPWDMNFDDTALEHVDSDLNPRLQLIYKNNHSTVVINGLFSVPNGILLVREMMETMVFGNFFGNWLKRLFKYPSRRFPGQEED